MTKKLLLVDYENVHKVDLSGLDETYRAIIFVGAQQNPPKAASNASTAHRFQRVDFLKVEGTGKNALDFHIAFQLGRTIETAPETACFILSRDKGFDPLIAHLNKQGLKCSRLESLASLVVAPQAAPDEPRCRHCHKASTIEHYGGLWCSNCGRFASPPDPAQLPSNQPAFAANRHNSHQRERYEDRGIQGVCGWCHQRGDMTGGIYDDGEWMCGNCIARHVR